LSESGTVGSMTASLNLCQYMQLLPVDSRSPTCDKRWRGQIFAIINHPEPQPHPTTCSKTSTATRGHCRRGVDPTDDDDEKAGGGIGLSRGGDAVMR
jgi:hypothetical protein